MSHLFNKNLKAFAYCSEISPNVDVTGVFLNLNDAEVSKTLLEAFSFFAQDFDKRKLKKLKKGSLTDNAFNLALRLSHQPREIFQNYYARV